MKKIRIAVTGTTGRMGRSLIQAIKQRDEVILSAGLVRHGSHLVGTDLGQLVEGKENGIILQDNLNRIIDDFDILIDFTHPESTLTYLDICYKNKKSIVIGTTAFNKQEKEKISWASQKIGIILAANFSIGINLLIKLLEQVTKIMGHYADIEIIEKHHRNKIDSPSGTALAMGEAIANIMNWNLDTHAIYDKNQDMGKRQPNKIGFSSIRAGDIIGEHTALFVDTGELIELTHKATSRMTFATGAVIAAQWLYNQSAGLYSMNDVLNLSRL